MTSNVLNRFEQAVDDDNKLVLGGTVEQEDTSVFTLAGDNIHSGDNTFSGTNSFSATTTFTGAVENAGGGNLKTKLLNVQIPDISTGSSVWVVPGFACTIVGISSVINGAIITVDAGITTEIAGTPVTNGDLTIAFTGSAAGVVDQNTPTAANAVGATEAIEVITDGLSTNTITANITLEVLPT